MLKTIFARFGTSFCQCAESLSSNGGMQQFERSWLVVSHLDWFIQITLINIIPCSLVITCYYVLLVAFNIAFNV